MALFLGQHPELRLCRDLANGFKHYRVRPGKGVDTNVTTTTVLSDMVLRPNDWPDWLHVTPLQPQPDENWMVIGSGGDVDMFELADKCLAFWWDFLK